MADKCGMHRTNGTTLQRFVPPVPLPNSNEISHLNSGNTHFWEANPNRISDKQGKHQTPPSLPATSGRMVPLMCF